MRSRSSPRAVCTKPATAESAEAATSAAGKPAAISCAKLGPDNTATRAPGAPSESTSAMVVPCGGSSPFDAQTRITPWSRCGRAASMVARTNPDGTATTMS